MVALEHRSALNDYPFVDSLARRSVVLDQADDTRKNADFVAYDLWSIGRNQLRGGSITAITTALFRIKASPASAEAGLGGAFPRATLARAITAACPARPAPALPAKRRASAAASSGGTAIIAHHEITDPLRESRPSPSAPSSAGARVSEQAACVYASMTPSPWVPAQPRDRASIDSQGEPRRRAARVPRFSLATFRHHQGSLAQRFAALEYHAYPGVELHESVRTDGPHRRAAQARSRHTLSRTPPAMPVSPRSASSTASHTVVGNADLLRAELLRRSGARALHEVLGNSLFSSSSASPASRPISSHFINRLSVWFARSTTERQVPRRGDAGRRSLPPIRAELP